MRLSAEVGVMDGTGSPKLFDQVRFAIAARHYSYRTEKAYLGWIKRFIIFHGRSQGRP